MSNYVFYYVIATTQLLLLYRSAAWWLATDELTTAHLSSSGCLPALCSHWTSSHETSATPQCQNSHDDVQLLYGGVLVLSISWGALQYLKSYVHIANVCVLNLWKLGACVVHALVTCNSKHHTQNLLRSCVKIIYKQYEKIKVAIVMASYIIKTITVVYFSISAMVSIEFHVDFWY